jgi:uncharacterized lipoprotein YajG
MEVRFVKKRSKDIRLFLSIISILVFTGCQGNGQTVNFDPHALSSPSPRTADVADDSLTIVVEPFLDSRPQQHRLGSRTHVWGGSTHFNAWNGNVSEGMATLAVEYLQQHQWRASQGVDDPTQTNPASDVILTGTVLSLKANAKSGFFFTDITVGMKVRFEAKNTVDGSTVRMVLGANGADTVTIFSPQDVEQLLNLVAKDLYKQLFQDLTVKNKAFRLKAGSRP